MGIPENVMTCLKVYFAAMVIFAIVFYIMHVLVPYKYVPKDFIPPEKWIGSFSKGQFTQYIIAIFLFPVPFVLGASLAFLDIPSDIAATVCAILLLAIMFLTVVIERKIDKW